VRIWKKEVFGKKGEALCGGGEGGSLHRLEKPLVQGVEGDKGGPWSSRGAIFLLNWRVGKGVSELRGKWVQGKGVVTSFLRRKGGGGKKETPLPKGKVRTKEESFRREEGGFHQPFPYVSGEEGKKRGPSYFCKKEMWTARGKGRLPSRGMPLQS